MGKKNKKNAGGGQKRRYEPFNEASASDAGRSSCGAQPGCRGLTNLGNTCFLNSILQCLNASTPFREELLRMWDEGLGKLSAGLCTVFRGLQGDSKGVVSPKGLLGALTEKFPWYKGGHQQDAHELLRTLLGSVSDEPTNAEKKLPKTPRVHGSPSCHCEKAVWESFRGHLFTTVLCWKCQKVSARLDPYLDLSLELPSSAAGVGPMGISAAAMTKNQTPAGTNSKVAPTKAKAVKEPEPEESKAQGGKHVSKKERRRLQAQALAARKSAEADEAAQGTGAGAGESSSKFRFLPSVGSWFLPLPCAAEEELETFEEAQEEAAEEPEEGEEEADVEEKGSDYKDAEEGSTKAEMASNASFGVISDADLEAVAEADLAEAEGDPAEPEDKEPQEAEEPAQDAEPQGEAEAPVEEKEQPEEEIYQITLQRGSSKENGGKWGFGWQSGAKDATTLLIVSITADSILDKWNLKQHSLESGLIVRPGDTVISVGSETSVEGMRKRMKSEDVLHIRICRSAGTAPEKPAAADESDDPEAEDKRDMEERRVAFEAEALEVEAKLPQELKAFNGMSVKKGSCDLLECVRRFTSSEALEDEYKATYQCEECAKEICGEESSRPKKGKSSKPRSFASRRAWLWAPLPPLLTLQLKRFHRRGSRYEKSSEHVQLPASLDLSQFIISKEQHGELKSFMTSSSMTEEPSEELSNCHYELYGICVHQGSMNGGHYIAYTNLGSSLDDEDWRGFSDSQVWGVTRADVLKAEAYVAFYRREGLVSSTASKDKKKVVKEKAEDDAEGDDEDGEEEEEETREAAANEDKPGDEREDDADGEEEAAEAPKEEEKSEEEEEGPQPEKPQSKKTQEDEKEEPSDRRKGKNRRKQKKGDSQAGKAPQDDEDDEPDAKKITRRKKGKTEHSESDG